MRHLWLSLALLWAGIVFFYSLQPSAELPRMFLYVRDLVLHFGAYLGLSFHLCFTAGRRQGLGRFHC